MSGEYTTAVEAVRHAFTDVPDSGRSKRACERWPLLAAVQRVATTRKTVAPAPHAAPRASVPVSAWWEE
jgi:hypothetical protein